MIFITGRGAAGERAGLKGPYFALPHGPGKNSIDPGAPGSIDPKNHHSPTLVILRMGYTQRKKGKDPGEFGGGEQLGAPRFPEWSAGKRE